MTALSKSDVAELLERYDADPTGALAMALGRVLDRPGATWAELIALAPLDPARRQRLARGETAALDELLSELNECRTLLGPAQESN
jgi:hypothetical protein